MDVASLLRAARWSTEQTQQQLARQVGISPSTLSRYESGAQQPSLALLDRVLAACGKDVRLALIERHANLESEFARRAALPWDQRVRQVELLRGAFLQGLAQLGPVALVGGSWAAELHGIPCEEADGALLLPDDDDVLRAVARFFARGTLPWREFDGRCRAVPVREDVFHDHPSARWWQRDVGHFRTAVVASGTPRPLEQRVDTEDGPLRVLAPQLLTADDGVQPETLARWSAWAAGRVVRADSPSPEPAAAT